jgi:hypothetical protein
MLNRIIVLFSTEGYVLFDTSAFARKLRILKETHIVQDEIFREN